MSLAREDLLLLMAFADGELEDPADQAKVHGLLADSEEARAIASEVGPLGAATGEWVRAGHDAHGHAATIAAFDMTDAIMARLEAEAEASTSTAGVSGAHEAMSGKLPKLDVPTAPIDLAERRRARATRNTGILATLAVAAAAAFAVHSQHLHASDEAPTMANANDVTSPGNAATPLASAAPTASSDPVTSPVAPPGAVAENAIPAATAEKGKANEIEVNAVNGHRDITVFYPQAGDTSASVVVWINE